MPDPVSWLLIRPGWKVYAADGAEVGEVDEVTGDDTQDIFDGIALATSVLGRPLYVPARHVSEITEGGVHLSLARDEVTALDEYREPATSAQIEANNKGGVAAAARPVHRPPAAAARARHSLARQWRLRLDDVHDRALEAYASSCLGIGGTELPGAERAARGLLERSPMRETGYALLMDALAAQGNVAEAMRVYDRARTTLDQELGITPGRAIQEAHARLLGVPSTVRSEPSSRQT
jgi:pentatricopeptide repeat protein